MILDAKTVAALSLPDGRTDVVYFDGEVRRFGYRLRQGAGGKVRRSWMVQYRFAGRSRRLLLGDAEVVTAAQARVMAQKALGRVANGEDPQADKVERRAKDRMNLKSVVSDYLAIKRDEVRPKTFEQIERYLAHGPHFRPLHNRPIDQVTQRDVAACLGAIMRERRNVAARAARSTLSAFFRWCLQQGFVTANPVINTGKPRDPGPRARVLSDPELIDIWRACGDDHFGKIVKLLILLAARRSEVGGMGWSELDDNGNWTIPKERSKNGREHTLPLPQAALDIIASVPKVLDRDQLFGERAARGFTRWYEYKLLLDQRSGVSDWTLHDLRRSAATGMATIGIQPHIIEQILNHQSGHKRGVAGIYNRSSYTKDVRDALLRWANHVDALVNGERKIIPLPANKSA
jgi:integrase